MMLTYKIMALIAFELVLSATVWFMSVRNARIDLACDTYAMMQNIGGDSVIKGNFSFRFFPNGTGMIGIDGELIHNGKSLKMLKEIRINYKPLDKGTYQLTNFLLSSSKRDEVPDYLIENNFFPVGKDRMKIIRVSRVDGAWLIGGRFTPAFMCINKF